MCEENYIRAKHILVEDEATAEEVLAKIAAGEDFEALMNAESDDVDAEGKVNGGEEGYIFKEGDFGNPAFEDAAKALAIGAYTTELVEVSGGAYSGYHIIKRYEMPENYFADNKDMLTAAIEADFDNKEYEKIVDEAYAAANIVKNESKIKGVKLYK